MNGDPDNGAGACLLRIFSEQNDAPSARAGGASDFMLSYLFKTLP